ncbi:hypothetical protein HX99_04365 [Peptococcaceae bacterium SCADC1_2_3]|nr:hypothetical protein DK28_0204755 [Peptococcaceae bacterium SCADC1_2_3]KFI34870.1 hypothetical protein HY02_03370 [Peptococcaceae bacterium SCADC1_2_3]KFI36426.1 hypothetical protein HX99_04365 [Peptococcaceae bacterium SCADC1_2_3]
MVNLTRKVISEENIERAMAKLLYNEMRRKLIEYELLDRNFTKKYGMSFEKFREKKVIEKLGYTWEVEKDYQNWEIAKDGIETMEEMIDKVRNIL